MMNPKIGAATILTVDDDSLVSGMLKRLLEEQGYCVHQAEDGALALKMLEEILPDLILLDAAMPNMDGFATCEQIQKNSRTAHIPVIMITSLQNDESVDKAFTAGASEFITKPIHWAVLRHRINTLLRARQAEIALFHSEAQFRSIFEQTAVGITLIDQQDKIISANPALQKMLGQDEKALINQYLQNIFQPYECHSETTMRQALDKGERSAYQLEKYFQVRDGSRLWVRMTISLSIDVIGEVNGYLYMVENITAQKQASAKQRIAAKVFENTNDGVLITDVNGNIIDINQSFSKITGFLYEEVLDKTPAYLKSNHHLDSFYKTLWENLKTYGFWRGKVINRFKNGLNYQQNMIISSVKDENNQTTAYVAIYSNTQNLNSPYAAINDKANINKLADNYDPLTSLPNSTLFQTHLSTACLTGEPLALLHIDLDNFQFINENFGYDWGDTCLQIMAQRLQYCTQTQHALSRIAGDEFAIIITPLIKDDTARQMATKIFEAFAEPINIDGHEIQIDCNIGISLSRNQAVTVKNIPQHIKSLIQHADLAMHLAKENSKNSYQVFTEVHNMFK